MHASGQAVLHDHGLYALIVEQSSDAIIFVDENGVIRLWNKGAQALFGYTSTETCGHSLDMIIPEHFRAAHWQGFNQAIENGVAKHAGKILTTRSTHRDGKKLYVDFSFCIITNPAGVVTGALATGRDSTTAYQNAVQQRRYIAELEGKLGLNAAD